LGERQTGRGASPIHARGRILSTALHINACLSQPPEVLTWADVQDLGRVYEHKKRGWCVEFRSVVWPGREKPRRVQVVEAKGYGRIDCEHAAIRVRLQIQAEHKNGRPLHEILSEYIDEVPEDAVLHRYREEYLPQRRTRHAEGRLSKKRLAEFEQYEGRGHLEFWAEVPLNNVRTQHLERWVHWLYQKGLRGGAIKHLVADFGAFLRYEHRIGSLRQMPQLPHVEWVPEEKTIPALEDALRVIQAIPDELSRGLWLARTLAGLRPAEARRLDVRHYNFATGELTIPTKHRNKRGRRLPLPGVSDELVAWLETHRRGAMGAEPLFPNPNAAKGRTEEGKATQGRWKPHAERLCWKAACESAGVQYCEPNAAGRHAFITHEVNQGTDIYAVKEWAGHVTISTTETYIGRASARLARRMRPGEKSSIRSIKGT
jgi:integrase